MSSFPLLQLPDIVLIDCLKGIKIADVVTLSLCSRRMRRIIRQVHLSIPYIAISSDTSMHVGFSPSSTRSIKQVLEIKIEKKPQDYIGELKSVEDGYCMSVRRTQDGSDIVTLYTGGEDFPRTYTLRYFYEELKKTFVIGESIIVFGASEFNSESLEQSGVYVPESRADLWTVWAMVQWEHFKSFDVVVVNFCLLNNKTPRKETRLLDLEIFLRTLIRCFKCPNHLVIKGCNFRGRIGKIGFVKELIAADFSKITFNSCNFTAGDVREFIQKWRNSEAFLKLEVLSVESGSCLGDDNDDDCSDITEGIPQWTLFGLPCNDKISVSLRKFILNPSAELPNQRKISAYSIASCVGTPVGTLFKDTNYKKKNIVFAILPDGPVNGSSVRREFEIYSNILVRSSNRKRFESSRSQTVSEIFDWINENRKRRLRRNL